MTRPLTISMPSQWHGVVQSVVLLAAGAAASAAPVTGWGIGQNNTSGTLSLGAAETASPVWGDGSAENADATSVVAPVPETTISQGDRITLSGSATLSGITASGDQFRWGLFHTAGSADFTGWLGCWAGNGNSASGGSLRERTAGNTAFYYSSTGSTLLATAAAPGTPLTDGVYTFSLTMERVAGGVQLTSSLVRTADGQAFTGHSVLDATPPLTTFNRVAFLAGSGMNADQIQLTDVDVTVATTDSDHDGMPDAWETANGLTVGADDSAGNPDGDGLTNLQEYTRGTNPQDRDTDHDGLDDGVETGTGTFVSAQNTGTSPLLADTDSDGIPDGAEVSAGSDPNDAASPGEGLGARLFGIDFNCRDAPGAPSQGRCRVIAGSATQAENAASVSKSIGSFSVTLSQPDGTALEFRGANGDTTRAIPGGDIPYSFLVADFAGTRTGELQLRISGLAAGDYVCRSWHLDTFTGSGLGFAQGASPTARNTVETRVGGVLRGSVQPTALGPAGLGTTFLREADVPTILTRFTSNGTDPVVIGFSSTQANGGNRFLLLNGFELFAAAP